MRINFLCKGVLAAATLCVAPVALAAAPNTSQPGRVKSGKEAFPMVASNILQQVQNDALHVRIRADQLAARLRSPFLNDWESDGSLLERMRARVNAMDKLLSQLRANQSEALPWQQQAIERIAPSVVNLTDTTQDAITALNNNKDHIYASNLKALTDHMYDEAKQIDQAVENFEKYADARHQVQQLKQALARRTNS